MPDSDDSAEIEATIAAIEEMTREKYPCTVLEHDAETDEFLVIWSDAADKEWGCWFTRALIEEVFTNATMH